MDELHGMTERTWIELEREEYRKYVGGRIKDARKKRYIKSREIAALIGVTPAHYCKIEKGDKLIRLDALVKIAHELGVSLDDLANPYKDGQNGTLSAGQGNLRSNVDV